MRNLANLLIAACLLFLPTSALAQGGAASDDPFGADPFGSGTARPSAVKRPNTRPVSQSKAAAVKAALKAKRDPARGSSMAALRIRATLGDETTQTFIELPLADAVQQLSRTHDIPIVVDKRALEEIGLTADTPVTLSLRNVSLRSFLRLMLRELDLTYMVKDEVMQITTVEAAEQNLIVEMYTFSEELTDKADKILKALTSSIVPDAWDEKGGPCSVTGIDNVLIVAAPEVIHEDVVEFLRKLQQAFEKHNAKN